MESRVRRAGLLHLFHKSVASWAISLIKAALISCLSSSVLLWSFYIIILWSKHFHFYLLLHCLVFCNNALLKCSQSSNISAWMHVFYQVKQKLSLTVFYQMLCYTFGFYYISHNRMIKGIVLFSVIKCSNHSIFLVPFPQL